MITSGFPMALSIRQPWAWLIVNGHKDIENRSWSTPYRGRVLIHAGKKLDYDYHPNFFPGITIPKPLDLGGIVGEAYITDCLTSSNSEWFEGEFGFVMRDAKPLPFIPYRGRLGFFEVQVTL
jgi:hypothetical protein